MSASAVEIFPADKRENLLLLSGAPGPDQTTDSLVKELVNIARGIAEQPVTQEELTRVKKFSEVINFCFS